MTLSRLNNFFLSQYWKVREFLFTTEGREYLFAKPAWRVSWFTAIWCRWRGHPAGIFYFNSGGSEPDYHCRNCEDLL